MPPSSRTQVRADTALAAVCALPVPAVLCDDTGRVLAWSTALEQATGREPAALAGHFFSELVETCPLCSMDCASLPATGVTVQTGLHAAGGATLPVELTVTRWPRPQGTPFVLMLLRLLPLKTDAPTVAAPIALPRQVTRFQELVGRNREMREVYRLLELAAASDATVLLSGESGTGKELAAAAIHRLSRRAAKPMVRVNCGALTETILESELFGHVKGAFTGAYQDHTGRFEAADGGTLLLDEIGEVTPATQVRLLRVLQSHDFERVGDVHTRHVDVRVVAATNRDLGADVRNGRFREDLYYRLRVFPIRMPPLRERLDDVPELVAAFIGKFAEQTGRPIRGLDEQAMRAIMDYCWPGNVRELENAIEYAFVTCQSDTIGLFDLPQELRRFELRREACQDRSRRGVSAAPLSAAMREVVASKASLEHLLQECGWNKAEAARRLGLSRTAVWKWMNKHGIPLEPPT